MADMTDVRVPRRVPITELCAVERAVNGKTYPKGTCYVTLSAAHDTVMQLAEDGPIESRYAALIPKDDLDHKYLKVVLDRAFPRWLMAHRTGINLQYRELGSLTVEWHDRSEDRRQVVDAVEQVNTLIEGEGETVKQLKELKQYLLLRMFADAREAGA